jgi:hypothetical protein
MAEEKKLDQQAQATELGDEVLAGAAGGTQNAHVNSIDTRAVVFGTDADAKFSASVTSNKMSINKTS